LVEITLDEIAIKRERKGRPSAQILEDIKFVRELETAILSGICDGSLERYGWCPSCYGYSKDDDGAYSLDDIEYAEGQACHIPTHQKDGNITENG